MNSVGHHDDVKFHEGVKFELLDDEGNLVPGVSAEYTDENGRYVFDELPAGTYRVQFTLTDEQQRIYQFTQQNVTTDDANEDSDADRATGITSDIVLDDTNTQLIAANDYDYNGTRPVLATQGIDPTWDAGVVLKRVSIGDLVWVDENRDGVQDEGEPGIPDVLLEIVDEEGNPVTDVFGNPV